MQKLENGIEVPTNSDTYNLTADLAKMGRTANVIIPTHSQAERDALTKTIGMAVTRLDITGAPIQIWDGTNWNHQGRPLRTSFNNNSMTNAGGTTSRLIADLGLTAKPYARVMTVSGQIGVSCGSVTSGHQGIYIAVSLMQASNVNAQGFAALAWTAPGNYLQSGYATTGEILVPANVAPLPRAWITVVNGTITHTVSTTTLTNIWCEERPA